MTWRERSRWLDLVLCCAFFIFAAVAFYQGDRVVALLWLILARQSTDGMAR
jgi:hypothetical protein